MAGKPAVAFTAWFDDQAGTLGGTLMEPNTFANSPSEDLSSTLNGTRTGMEIGFTKIYDPGQGAHAQPIQYAGKANRDFTWVVGKWRIAGWFEWSGPFEMSRQTGAIEQAEREQDVELIVE